MSEDNELLSKIKLLFPALTESNKKIELTKEELCNQLAKALCPSAEFSSSEAEHIVCNYVFIMDLVRKDLNEIENRLIRLKADDVTTPKDEDYEHKRIRFFSKINKEAKSEIVDFISNGIEHILCKSKTYKYSDRIDDELTMLFLNGRYNYSFFGRYYDPDYDFSTEVKIRFIPGVDIQNMMKTVAEYIELKKKDPEKFGKVIDAMVEKNHCMQYIYDKIKSHYYLHKRSEIFETLTGLYDSKRYISFISLAMTQVEGLFYDCITILNRKELGNKAGTLVEKIDKVFAQNEKVKQALYPYFAFSVPVLRNEIAHNGITSSENPMHLCSEIILDMYCLVYWACQLSDDKYSPIAMAYDELLKSVKEENSESQESIVFLELFYCYQICDHEFLKVLASTDKYNDEIQFYKDLYAGEDVITIKEKIEAVSAIMVSNDFWLYIKNNAIKYCDKKKKNKPYDLVDFIVAVRNAFIPFLISGSTEKATCQEVSKELKAFES